LLIFHDPSGSGDAEPLSSLFGNLCIAPEERICWSQKVDSLVQALVVIDGDEVADNLQCVAQRCGWGDAERPLTDGAIQLLDLAVRLWVIRRM